MNPAINAILHSSSPVAVNSVTLASVEAPSCEEPILSFSELSDPQDIDLKMWPVLHSDAKYGLAWDIAKAATENSEADPVAVLMSALTYAATYFGRETCINISDNDHHARLFTLIVGATSAARKGTSAACVKKISAQANKLLIAKGLSVPQFINGSVSSGEGLTKLVRDESDERDSTGKPKWLAASDKRALLIDSEFAQYCAVAKRDGNTASMVIRNAWDGEDLQPLTKSESIKATEAHINIIGHITLGELLEKMPRNELSNGAMNRFLITLVRRPKLVPSPLPTPPAVIEVLAKRLYAAVIFSQESIRAMELDDYARELWENEMYRDLNTETGDRIVDDLIGRSDAYAKRLALVFALLDLSPVIRVRHLRAAQAIVKYRRDCVMYLYGQASEGNDIGGRIMKALSDAPAHRVMHTDLKQIVGCKNERAKFAQAVEQLQAVGKVKIDIVKSGRQKIQYIEVA